MTPVATSNFDGTENPLSESSNWRTGDSIFGSTAPLQKVAGVVECANLGLGNAVFQGAPLNGNQYQTILISFDLSIVWGLALFARYAQGGDGSGYFLDMDSFGNFSITRRDVGADFVLATTTYTPASDEVPKIEAIGSVINAYLGSTLILTANDSTYSNGEVAIVISVSNDVGNVQINNWEAGDDRLGMQLDLIDDLAFETINERIF